ncbi:uncharacterized protein [Melanerpes formicivorus]|uniref:uncharacterized protein n=1 Tax=Melanerpes formicivorus TaxID=211600 RepID=UPI00358E5317
MMSSSSGRQYKAIQFLLHKSIPERGEIFDDVTEEEMQPGDIVLFPTENLQSTCFLFKHAAVCLGDGEVIHLQGRTGEGNTGLISKEGFQAMKKAIGNCQIYRKRGGIDLNDFHSKVRKVMIRGAKDHPDTNNCIHFALWLLGLEDFYRQLVEIQNKDCKEEAVSSSSERLYNAIQFLLRKRISGHGKVFDEVTEEEMQPGDIVLVPMDDKNPLYCLFKHAAVYIGDGEVIQFQGSTGEPGQISKEGFQAMKMATQKCQIYRKRGGIDLNDFHSKVREAMHSKAKYHLGTNNCIHFALWLLGLADFNIQLVEIEKEIDTEEAVEISDEDDQGEAMSIPSVSPSRQGSDIPGRATGSSKGWCPVM